MSVRLGLWIHLDVTLDPCNSRFRDLDIVLDIAFGGFGRYLWSAIHFGSWR